MATKTTNSWFDSIEPYIKSMEQYKSWAVPSMLGLTTIGTIYLARKYRAKIHDNIPLMAPEDFSFFGGHLPKVRAIQSEDIEGNDLHAYIYQEAKKAGFPPCFCMSLPMNQKVIFLNDPKLIKYILETNADIVLKSDHFIEEYNELLGHGIFASNGAQWKFHRKVASRMFSMRNLKDFMYEMSVKHTHSTTKKLKQLEINTDKKEGIDINDILGRFSLDTFCEIAFGVDTKTVSDYPKQCEFGDCFDDLVMRVDRRGSDPFWKIKKMLNIGTENIISYNAKIISNFVNNILDNKMKNKSKTNISDETGKGSYDILSLFLKHNPNLTKQELKDIALNFIIAGRDTTRTLLSWFIYELCKPENKNVIEKIYEEIDNLGDAKYNDFHVGLRYLEGALCEALRLHPSVPSIGRSAIKDIKLPNTNYVIRKGDIVLSHCYTTGRCPNIWGKDVLKFNPDRWKEKGVNTYDQYTFQVFNVSPRGCLGKHFAILESKVFSYYLLKEFKFERVKDKKCTIKTGALLNMEHGFYINLKSR